jgi:hypothetical protein
MSRCVRSVYFARGRLFVHVEPYTVELNARDTIGQKKNTKQVVEFGYPMARGRQPTMCMDMVIHT